MRGHAVFGSVFLVNVERIGELGSLHPTIRS